jgi:SAM-dependent methyltransferase
MSDPGATSAEREYKDRQRQSWAAGEWPAIARTIQDAADVVVDEIGVAAGHDVLDVGTGNGNAAIAAAARGARVTGLDLVPELLAAARRRADDAGLRVEWVEGDAEELPFEEASFDRVTSIFGVIFAFDHARSATELVRVARPGAVIGVAGWTPEGVQGRLFESISSYLPDAPPPEQNPLRWGDEEYVRTLFSAPGVEVSCERRSLDLVFASSEAWIDELASKLGPMIGTREMLEEQGSWSEARAAQIQILDGYNQAGDGTLRAPAEYLLTRCIIGANE